MVTARFVFEGIFHDSSFAEWVPGVPELCLAIFGLVVLGGMLLSPADRAGFSFLPRSISNRIAWYSARHTWTQPLAVVRRKIAWLLLYASIFAGWPLVILSCNTIKISVG